MLHLVVTEQLSYQVPESNQYFGLDTKIRQRLTYNLLVARWQYKMPTVMVSPERTKPITTPPSLITLPLELHEEIFSRLCNFPDRFILRRTHPRPCFYLPKCEPPNLGHSQERAARRPFPSQSFNIPASSHRTTIPAIFVHVCFLCHSPSGSINRELVGLAENSAMKDGAFVVALTRRSSALGN